MHPCYLMILQECKTACFSAESAESYHSFGIQFAVKSTILVHSECQLMRNTHTVALFQGRP